MRQGRKGATTIRSISVGGGWVDVSNAAMLSAHKAGEEPLLVAGSSDMLIGPEIGIDEFAAAAKSTGREVLSHLGSRFHRVYCAI